MPSLTIAIPQDGPFVQIMVSVSGARGQALKAAGLPIPPPVVGRGLLDTGASVSAIDRRATQQLGLAATGHTLIHTPSTGTQPHPVAQFDVSFAISMDNQQIHILPTSFLVIESDFAAQGFLALLGGDLLDHGIFFTMDRHA